MYDFNLGSADYIKNNEEQYLLSIKKMLPRWLNSISDSIFLQLHGILSSHCNRKEVVIAETGVGASTILFAYHAMKNEGQLFSWDIAGAKGSEIRNIINDTLCKTLKVSVWDIWTFIPSQSLSPYLGIPVVGEMNLSLDFMFCDGDHTWNTIEGEIHAFSSIASQKCVFAMDDAYLEYKGFNTSYINTIRKKLGLCPVSISDNECKPFGEQAEKLLGSNFTGIEKIASPQNEVEEFDILHSYNVDDQLENNIKAMNELAAKNSRFVAWKLAKL